MNIKRLILIIVSIFVIGIMAAGFTSADRIIDNATEIYIEAFVAGSTITANFSYDYLDRPGNIESSPLIFRINITSNDEINFPVWEEDFKINGSITRCEWNILGLCFFEKTINFNCSEESPLTISHPLGKEDVYPQDGTFYCFNEEGDLNLNRKDEVFLNIKSHPALWPGQYTISAELYYLTDTYPPIVNILNKSYFDQYFSDGSHVSFEVEIIDVNLEDWNAKIITPDRNISFAKEKVSGNIYRFFQTLPTTNPIPKGYYEILVTAEDIYGNIGSDNTTLRIDRTPPEIELLQPTEGEIYSEILPIEANVTDEKAGVDENEVYYRLREIIDGTICPEIGVPVGNYSCTRTDWLNLPYNGITFEKDVNTTELNLTSGEYWLDIRAEDILGNIGFLE